MPKLPTPAEELENDRVQSQARKIWAEALAQPEFADVGVIWAYSAGSGSDHRNGRCCDFMVTHTKRSMTNAERVAMGNKIRAYFVKHADRLHVQGIIWNHRVTGFPIGGGVSGQPDVTYRGPWGVERSYSQPDQHTDHVHVQVTGEPAKFWLKTPVVSWDGKSFPGALAFYLGARGDHVTRLGERLVAHGWTGYADGPGPEFTETDRKAVAWFQAKQGWTGSDADGYPGAQTWALLMAAPAAPKPPVTNPAPVTDEPTEEADVPKFKKVISLDAPGAGNWQGAARNAKTGEWFLAQSRKREDGGEDAVLYRFDKAGKYQDKMTLARCSHVYGFGVSDTNILWVTWDDAKSNDVVTLDYQAGKTVTKSAGTKMHVFSDRSVDVSFSDDRKLVALRQAGYPSGYETYRVARKEDILENRESYLGEVKIKTSSSRVVQGFAPEGDHLYVLIGLAPKSAFRIEKWSIKTGKKVDELKLDADLGLPGGSKAKNEPEGMDGRYFCMKSGVDAERRLNIYELTDF